MERRLSSPATRALLILLGLALAIAGAEVMVRAFGLWKNINRRPDIYQADPLRGYRIHPDYRGRAYGASLKTNHLGLRDRDYGPKDHGTYRILVLGDSVTFGLGVEADEAYPRQLERMLNSAASGRTYEVINSGVPGYNAENELATLRELNGLYRPDLAVMLFIENDIEPSHQIDPSGKFMNLPFSGKNIGLAWPRSLYAVSLKEEWHRHIDESDWWIVRNLYLINFLRDRLGRRPIVPNEDVSQDELPSGRRFFGHNLSSPLLEGKIMASRRRWSEIEELLVAMQKALSERGAKLLVVTWDGFPLESIIERICTRHGIFHTDIAPYYSAKRHSLGWDLHPSPEGHEVIARATLLALQRFGLVPPLYQKYGFSNEEELLGRYRRLTERRKAALEKTYSGFPSRIDIARVSYHAKQVVAGVRLSGELSDKGVLILGTPPEADSIWIRGRSYFKPGQSRESRLEAYLDGEPLGERRLLSYGTVNGAFEVAFDLLPHLRGLPYGQLDVFFRHAEIDKFRAHNEYPLYIREVEAAKAPMQGEQLVIGDTARLVVRGPAGSNYEASGTWSPKGYPAFRLGRLQADRRGRIAFGTKHWRSGPAAITAKVEGGRISSANSISAPRPEGADASETFPAAGDIDGDGLSEIVMGLAGGGRCLLAIFEPSDHGYVFRRWHSLERWPTYCDNNGQLAIALGDVDGDGSAEVVAAQGKGGDGTFAVLDDLGHGLRYLGGGTLGWPEYIRKSGELRPATGDLDGDGRDELLFGLGPGGLCNAAVYDDASSGFKFIKWRQVGLSSWKDYCARQGGVEVAACNVDGDSQRELVFVPSAGKTGKFAIYDDARAGLKLITDREGPAPARDGESLSVTCVPAPPTQPDHGAATYGRTRAGPSKG